MEVLYQLSYPGAGIDSRVTTMSQRSGQPIVAASLVVTGVASIVAGIVLAVAVDPLLGLIALIGVLDLALAWAFATGRLGGRTAGVSDPTQGEASADPSPDPAADPSYNPYARED
jgi:hypothetical protein